MIIPERPIPVCTGYDPAAGGCSATDCKSQDTATLDGLYGRRCREHSPWLTLAAEGRFTAAWASLLAWLRAAA